MGDEHSIDWSFLERIIDKDLSVAEQSRGKYSKVGEIRSHRAKINTLDIQGPSIDHKALAKVAEIRSKNRWDDLPFYMDRVEQTYALACSPRYGNAVKQYAETATEFLGERLKLDISPFNWRQLSGNHDYSDFDNQCLVVDDFVTLRVYSIFKDISSGTHTDLKRLISRGGGGIVLYDGKGNRFIGISADKTAIQSPFSEMLPVFLKDRADEAYVSGSAGKLAAVETVSESIAYMLAREMADKMGIPNGNKAIDQNINELLARQMPQYEHVPNGISWIKEQNRLGKDGVKGSFNLFMRSPMEYMRAIGATSNPN